MVDAVLFFEGERTTTSASCAREEPVRLDRRDRRVRDASTGLAPGRRSVGAARPRRRGGPGSIVAVRGRGHAAAAARGAGAGRPERAADAAAPRHRRRPQPPGDDPRRAASATPGSRSGSADVFVNVAGGLRRRRARRRPGDRARDRVGPARTCRPAPLVAFGEIGLTGRLRSVPQPDAGCARRQRLGLSHALAHGGTLGVPGTSLRTAQTVAEAIAMTLPAAPLMPRTADLEWDEAGRRPADPAAALRHHRPADVGSTDGVAGRAPPRDPVRRARLRRVGRIARARTAGARRCRGDPRRGRWSTTASWSDRRWADVRDRPAIAPPGRGCRRPGRSRHRPGRPARPTRGLRAGWDAVGPPTEAGDIERAIDLVPRCGVQAPAVSPGARLNADVFAHGKSNAHGLEVGSTRPASIGWTRSVSGAAVVGDRDQPFMVEGAAAWPTAWHPGGSS